MLSSLRRFKTRLPLVGALSLSLLFAPRVKSQESQATIPDLADPSLPSQLTNSATLKTVLELTGSTNQWTQLKAIELLQHTPRSNRLSVVPLLSMLVTNSSPWVRIESLGVLKTFGPIAQEALPNIVHMATNEPTQLGREALSAALDSIAPPRPKPRFITTFAAATNAFHNGTTAEEREAGIVGLLLLSKTNSQASEVISRTILSGDTKSAALAALAIGIISGTNSVFVTKFGLDLAIATDQTSTNFSKWLAHDGFIRPLLQRPSSRTNLIENFRTALTNSDPKIVCGAIYGLACLEETSPETLRALKNLRDSTSDARAKRMATAYGVHAAIRNSPQLSRQAARIPFTEVIYTDGTASTLLNLRPRRAEPRTKKNAPAAKSE